METVPKFSAFRVAVNNKQNVFVTIPGEALTELGYYLLSIII
jgi:hypothetical protein